MSRPAATPSLPNPTRHIQSPRQLRLPESAPRPSTSMPAPHQTNRTSACSRESLSASTHRRGLNQKYRPSLGVRRVDSTFDGVEMKLRFPGLSAAILGCTVALVFPAAVASADPPDPHQPDMTKGYCPGGRWGFGDLAVCDGEKYPDGSFWHQWMQTWFTGPQFYFDCVGGNEPLPGPPPPGGCDGAIPPDQPAQPAT
ncbi:Hypothetical protein MUW33_64 [Mycobacterium canetti]|nr:Hypothetical protein MUW33_64 [Mycobacterium canetti]